MRPSFYYRVTYLPDRIIVTIPWWGWPFLVLHLLIDKQWREFMFHRR